MKKQILYIISGLASCVTILYVTSLCSGQTTEEKAYYNNPDILTNRLQREKEAEEETGMEFYKNTRIVFAQVEDARKILTAKDSYINSQTAFDRKVRMCSEKPVSEQEYMDFLSEQVQPWNENEKITLNMIIKNVAYRFKEYNLNFPPKIVLIKTTGKEEGGTAYCRDNAIVLPQNQLMQMNANPEPLFVHELFHIFTKNNLKTREALYDIINFKKCEKAELPKKLLDIEITNPDVPAERYYIELQKAGGTVKVIPMITLPDFDVKKGRTFFRYLKLKLVEVEKTGGEFKYVRNNAGEPLVFNDKEIPDYVNKVGSNTSYLFHPEEILADNFTIMIMGQPVKSKWVIDKMRSVLEN